MFRVTLVVKLKDLTNKNKWKVVFLFQSKKTKPNLYLLLFIFVVY